MNKVVSILIAFLFLTTCCFAQQAKNVVIPINKANYAILPNKIYLGSSNPFDSSYQQATLTNEEIILIKNLIKKKIKKNAWSKHTLGYYCIQLIPVIDKNKNKFVYVNAFPKNEKHYFSNWRTEIVSVLDGGDDFFQAKINLTTETIISFGYNGVG